MGDPSFAVELLLRVFIAKKLDMLYELLASILGHRDQLTHAERGSSGLLHEGQRFAGTAKKALGAQCLHDLRPAAVIRSEGIPAPVFLRDLFGREVVVNVPDCLEERHSLLRQKAEAAGVGFGELDDAGFDNSALHDFSLS
jgi:hypothetical protein